MVRVEEGMPDGFFLFGFVWMLMKWRKGDVGGGDLLSGVQGQGANGSCDETNHGRSPGCTSATAIFMEVGVHWRDWLIMQSMRN
jgi:hypothetical protein